MDESDLDVQHDYDANEEKAYFVKDFLKCNVPRLEAERMADSLVDDIFDRKSLGFVPDDFLLELGLKRGNIASLRMLTETESATSKKRQKKKRQFVCATWPSAERAIILTLFRRFLKLECVHPYNMSDMKLTSCLFLFAVREKVIGKPYEKFEQDEKDAFVNKLCDLNLRDERENILQGTSASFRYQTRLPSLPLDLYFARSLYLHLLFHTSTAVGSFPIATYHFLSSFGPCLESFSFVLIRTGAYRDRQALQ